MTSSDSETQKRNIFVTFLIIIGIILIWIIFWFISFFIKWFPQFKWWYSNKGSGCKKKFDIILFLLSYENKFFFSIAKLFLSSEMSQLNRQQTFFISKMVLPRIKRKFENKSVGFVSPRHVCESLLFQSGEDDLFDKWIAKNNLNPQVPAEYDINGKLLTNGVYPSPDIKATKDWKKKLEEWTGSEWELNEIEGQKIYLPYSVNLFDDESIDNSETVLLEWYNVEKHPDNFLARYGIDPLAPIVISFYNGTYNYKNIEWNPNSFNNLIGNFGTFSRDIGGWVGFLVNMGDDISFDKYMNYLYSDINVYYVDVENEEKCNPTTDVGSSVIRGISTALGVGAMIAFTGGTGALVAGAFAGLAIGTFDTLSSLPNKCKKNSQFLSAFTTTF